MSYTLIFKFTRMKSYTMTGPMHVLFLLGCFFAFYPDLVKAHAVSVSRTERSSGHDDAEKINEKDPCSHLENPNGGHKLHVIDGVMCCGCGRGYRVAAPCRPEEYHTTKCEPCEKGTYIEKFSHNLRKCKVDTRKPCPDPNHLFIAGTSSSPSTCVCRPGFFSLKDGPCNPHRECEPGLGVSRRGNFFHDTECVRCSHGFDSPNNSSSEECVPTAVVRNDPRNRHLFTDELNFVTSQPEKSRSTALQQTTSWDGLDTKPTTSSLSNSATGTVQCDHFSDHLQLFNPINAISGFLVLSLLLWFIWKRSHAFFRRRLCCSKKTKKHKEKKPPDELLLPLTPQRDEKRIDQRSKDNDLRKTGDTVPGDSTSGKMLRVPQQKLSVGQDGGITESSSRSAHFVQVVNEMESSSSPFSSVESHEMTCLRSPNSSASPANHDNNPHRTRTDEYCYKMNRVKMKLTEMMDDQKINMMYRHFSQNSSSNQEAYLENLRIDFWHSAKKRFCVAFENLRDTLGQEFFNPATIQQYFRELGNQYLVEIMEPFLQHH